MAAEVLTQPLSGHLMSSRGTEKGRQPAHHAYDRYWWGHKVLHKDACVDAKLLQLLYELELFNLLFLLLNSYMAADGMLKHFSSATEACDHCQCMRVRHALPGNHQDINGPVEELTAHSVLLPCLFSPSTKVNAYWDNLMAFGVCCLIRGSM